MEKRTFGLFLLLLVVLASHEMVMSTDARLCETQSHKFEGSCFRDSNCATVCKTEGYSGGKCRGLRRRCFCTKQC